MFRLEKWYLDLVTDDGIVFIGYSARLSWGVFRARYRAILLCSPGSPPEESYSLRRSPDPTRQYGGSLSWDCKPLGLYGHWTPKSPPVRRRLFENTTGVADWDCVAPTAEASVRMGDRTLDGWGYAERLVLTTPPWKLGAGDLFWGRFVNPTASVIWVYWEGSNTPPLVMVNGIDQAGATVSAGEIHLPNSKEALSLGSPRVLREGPVVDLLASVPRLIRRLPGGLDRVIERKWLSPGRFVSQETEPASGWAIHEEVKWPFPDGS